MSDEYITADGLLFATIGGVIGGFLGGRGVNYKGALTSNIKSTLKTVTKLSTKNNQNYAQKTIKKVLSSFWNDMSVLSISSGIRYLLGYKSSSSISQSNFHILPEEWKFKLW